MPSNRIILLLSVFAVAAVFSLQFAPDVQAAQRYLPHMLGDTLVTIRIIENGHGYTYVSLHENESTSLAVASDLVARDGGRIVALSHGGERSVSFRLGGTLYQFDPNRIFSDAGIRRTLTEWGASYSEQAHALVRELANSIKRELGLSGLRGGMLVALHNNTNGAYSVGSYEEGGLYASSAQEVFVGEGDNDNFFLVTNAQVFAHLKEAGFSVVLQSSSAPDDGSLSIYAARLGLSYVNPEAQHGHTSEQRRMLEAL